MFAIRDKLLCQPLSLKLLTLAGTSHTAFRKSSFPLPLSSLPFAVKIASLEAHFTDLSANFYNVTKLLHLSLVLVNFSFVPNFILVEK